MGKPLSRPDCLRQSPACLGKGEDEDGYIEDCYVPQRSIYDTMRINEQIDQGSKLSQPSKSTLEKGDSSTISSNGTLGPPTVFESKAPESKKLDERVIFDALKLSSDVSKSAPAPPRRRPNPEKKENVNRRSWKSFMPPNFPEFAERIEASLSEVSEAGVSNPSLQEKQESVSTLAESSRQSDQGESMSEPLTMEHVSKPPGIPEMREVKHLNDAPCEFSQDERQPLLGPEDMAADLSGGKWRNHGLLSATWPRVMKNAIKAGLGAGRHDTLEADDTECVVETVPLSPCLSEELLNPGLAVLITPNLREKTESELRFEEDERLIMMEAEEEWEEGLLSEKGKAAEKRCCRLTDISEEKEQLSAPAVTLAGAGESFAGVQETSKHPSPWQEFWDDAQLQADSSAPVPRETHRDLNSTLGGEEEEEEEEGDSVCSAEARAVRLEEEEFASGLTRCGSPLAPEHFSDTDSVQMFLELEKLCMNDDERDGAAPLDPEVQDAGLYAGEPNPQKALEQLADHLTEASQLLAHLEVSVADSAVVSDLEDFDATYGSQVASTAEPTLSESYSERETSGDTEPAALCSPPVAKDATPQHSLSPVVSQIEECGTELLAAHEPARSSRGDGFLDFVLGESAVPAGLLPCTHVFTAGGEIGVPTPPVACCGAEEDFPSQDELATTAEELDSQPEFDLAKEAAGPEGREPSASFYEPNPSERTDFSNWDVPELVSEDEVTELDKENLFHEGQMNEIEQGDSSRVPLPSGVLAEEDWEELAELTDPSKALDLCRSGHLEVLARLECDGQGAADASVTQARTPGVPEQGPAGGPAVERDFLEHEDLEWLFGPGGGDEVGRVGEGGAGSVQESSASLFFVECLSAAQPRTDAFVTTAGAEVASLGSGSRDKAPDAFLDSTEAFAITFPSAAAGDSDTDGPALAESPTVSSAVASAPSAGACAVDATTLSETGGRCGLGGLQVVPWVPAAQELAPPASPTAEEIISTSVPFCMDDVPTQPPGREELPTVEEWTGAPMPNVSEEGVQVTQGLGDLVTVLPVDTQGLSAAVEPSGSEDGSLPLAPGAFWDAAGTTQQSPTLAAPEFEEQLTSPLPDTEEPSTSFLTAEGPPAGTDGLVPDNEVFVSLLPTHSCVGH
ncbi:hypothetical protein lerEdw1_009542 [Lerista edwardsae]|nr:hypothetical protein lerEdw1_009542 [Lerista edwardsae]